MRKIEREPNGCGIFRPGQDLVAAGYIGKAGMKAALKYKRNELDSRFFAAFLRQIEEKAEEQWNITPELLAGCGATEWEYVTEGGIFAALWNISGAYEQGICVELLKIPVQQELIEICELFDLNPYRLFGGGGCVVAAAGNGGDLVRELGKHGIPAVWIGKVEDGIGRKIVTGAGTGFLERPRPDEICKLTGGLPSDQAE